MKIKIEKATENNIVFINSISQLWKSYDYYTSVNIITVYIALLCIGNIELKAATLGKREF